jgi:predicted flap endonuclease-1-like 5' DNA nuclease
MRLDYALYAVAVILFILTGVGAYMAESLWVVTTAVLGLVFIGIGYWQRPHEEAIAQNTPQTTITTMPPTVSVTAPPPPPSVPKAETKPIPVVETKLPSAALLDVKGIKEKRAQQLKTLGINTVEDLAKASPEDLAAKLKIAPYFTSQWIENAKKIIAKS